VLSNRYSQAFHMVSSCHVADVPSVSDFVPNPTNHVRVYGRNSFSYPSPQLFQTRRKRRKKNFVFNVSLFTEVQGC